MSSSILEDYQKPLSSDEVRALFREPTFTPDELAHIADLNEDWFESSEDAVEKLLRGFRSNLRTVSKSFLEPVMNRQRPAFSESAEEAFCKYVEEAVLFGACCSPVPLFRGEVLYRADLCELITSSAVLRRSHAGSIISSCGKHVVRSAPCSQVVRFREDTGQDILVESLLKVMLEPRNRRPLTVREFFTLINFERIAEDKKLWGRFTAQFEDLLEGVKPETAHGFGSAVIAHTLSPLRDAGKALPLWVAEFVVKHDLIIRGEYAGAIASEECFRLLVESIDRIRVADMWLAALRNPYLSSEFIAEGFPVLEEHFKHARIESFDDVITRLFKSETATDDEVRVLYSNLQRFIAEQDESLKKIPVAYLGKMWEEGLISFPIRFGTAVPLKHLSPARR